MNYLIFLIFILIIYNENFILIYIYSIFLQHAIKKDMDDKAKDPNFNISQFLQNSYKHPNFLNEKPIEETKKTIKSFEHNVTKKKIKSSTSQKNEKMDSTIDIPNIVRNYKT